MSRFFLINKLESFDLKLDGEFHYTFFYVESDSIFLRKNIQDVTWSQQRVTALRIPTGILRNRSVIDYRVFQRFWRNEFHKSYELDQYFPVPNLFAFVLPSLMLVPYI